MGPAFESILLFSFYWGIESIAVESYKQCLLISMNLTLSCGIFLSFELLVWDSLFLVLFLDLFNLYRLTVFF